MVNSKEIVKIADAEFSEDKNYRYSLCRIFNSDLPLILYIMYNPSTADRTDDDPTIKRLINRTSGLGYGGFYVSLYSYRLTETKE